MFSRDANVLIERQELKWFSYAVIECATLECVEGYLRGWGIAAGRIAAMYGGREQPRFCSRRTSRRRLLGKLQSTGPSATMMKSRGLRPANCFRAALQTPLRIPRQVCFHVLPQAPPPDGQTR